MSKTSLDGTKYMLGLVQNALANQEKQLAKLQNCTELEVSVSYGKGEYIRKRYIQKQHMQVLKASDSYQSADGSYEFVGTTKFTTPDGKAHTMRFEEERSRQVRQTESNIKNIKEDIKFLNQKIAEYKPVE